MLARLLDWIRKRRRESVYGHDWYRGRPPPDPLEVEASEQAMTIEEASRILKDMCDNAPSRDKVLVVHLFGIVYGNKLKANGLRTRDVMNGAGIGNLGPTLNAGIKLSEYVILAERGEGYIRLLTGPYQRDVG